MARREGYTLSDIWKQLEMVFWNIFHRPRLSDIADILLIAVLLYWLICFSRQTRSLQVIKGLAILIGLNYITSLLGLTAVNWVLRTILNNGIILMIVLFQPELRRVLEQLGRGAHMEKSAVSADENSRVINEITSCLLRLSRRRVGALIVFEQKTGLKDVMETGVRVDSAISGALLENIFEPNTPLHDGAVIICAGRVASAACVLTLSDSASISQDLGTRHRAALGISEQTDAKVLIVSEETGIISMAKGGRLTRHLDEEALRRILGEMYAVKDTGWRTRVSSCFRYTSSIVRKVLHRE